MGITHRCTICGYPEQDHVALRHVLRAWVAHRAKQPRQWLDRQLLKLWRLAVKTLAPILAPDSVFIPAAS